MCTDAWKGYTTLAKQGYRHKTISVSHSLDPDHALPARSACCSLAAQTLASGYASLLATHRSWSRIKDRLLHNVWMPELDEFAFRFNRGHSRQ